MNYNMDPPLELLYMGHIFKITTFEPTLLGNLGMLGPRFKTQLEPTPPRGELQYGKHFRNHVMWAYL